MSKIKDKRDVNSMGRVRKHVAENKQLTSNERGFEDCFQHFTRQYKEEITLYKRGIKRFSEKAQELEMSILEYKSALDRSQEIITNKEREVEKYISEQNLMKDEKEKLLIKYHELEKHFAQNEVKYTKDLDAVTRDKENCEKIMNNDRENHNKIVMQLNEKVDDLKQQLEAQSQGISILKIQIKDVEEIHKGEINQLQANFAEQKLKLETENQRQINNLMVQLEDEKQRSKQDIDKHVKQQEEMEDTNMQNRIQQAEEIENLHDELNKCQDMIKNLENDKKRLIDEQNYRLSTFERVFTNPINALPKRQPLTDDIRANKSMPAESMSNEANMVEIAPAKNATNEGNTKLRAQRPRCGTQRQPSTNNLNASNHNFPKPRAVKRNVSYIAYKDFSSSDDDNNPTQIDAEQFKVARIEPPSCSASTSTSKMRFTTNHKTKTDCIVNETSESDPFERVKHL